MKEIVVDGRRRMMLAMEVVKELVAQKVTDRIVRVRGPRYEPHQGAREMERRRKQRARSGLPVAEPASAHLAACVGIDEEGAS